MSLKKPKLIEKSNYFNQKSATPTALSVHCIKENSKDNILNVPNISEYSYSHKYKATSFSISIAHETIYLLPINSPIPLINGSLKGRIE